MQPGTRIDGGARVLNRVDAVARQISHPLPETVQKVQDLLNGCRNIDGFNTCYFDLTSLPSLSGDKELKVIKTLLPGIIDEQRDRHVIAFKLLQNQARVVKYLVSRGFNFHSANHESMLLTLCQTHRKITSCTYPKYSTVSVGVTGVVFNQQLDKVLLIQEKWGGLNKMKPPTGGVEYLDIHEDPLTAVVRELKEETNLQVDPYQAVLVGTAWTQHLRGRNPDVNFVFAFLADEGSELKAQEGEISKVGWFPITEYLNEADESKPYVMKQIVRCAFEAIKQGKEWTFNEHYWAQEKPVTLFSYNQKN